LYVRPALLAYGRHVEAVAGRHEANLVKGEWVGLGRVFDNLVLSEVFVLRTLHRRREDELHVFFGHRRTYLFGERFAVANPLAVRLPLSCIQSYITPHAIHSGALIVPGSQRLTH
jgi:hypothetical protein